MDKKLEKELVALAKKYKMEVSLECLYCGHRREALGWPETGESFMVTLTEKKPKEGG
jgi:hypothetical protein